MDGKYYYAVEDGICILKPVGRITMPLSMGVDVFLNDIFNTRPIREVIIDMTETEYIDSTNLGILLLVHRRHPKSEKKRPIIVTDGERIHKILVELNFDKIFNIIDQNPVSFEGKFKHLPISEGGSGELRRTILKSHYNLMLINDKNKKQFADIITLLGEDPQKEKDDAGKKIRG